MLVLSKITITITAKSNMSDAKCMDVCNVLDDLDLASVITTKLTDEAGLSEKEFTVTVSES